ncbi:hypothetical protein PALB_3110 [Pseudoalteromonas luteoviolacea B = ATCC 29581]|nr:hypothetical protein PALB_3110 [Pseudoalteromonas luteoviolacea B = ATCC 29581]
MVRVGLLVFFVFACNPSMAQSWSTWFESDSLKIEQFTKPSDIVQVRVTARMHDATRHMLLAVLDDVENASRWLPYIKQANVVSRPTPAEVLVFSIFDAPFPITMRQLITRACLSEEVKQGRTQSILTVKSIDETVLPEPPIMITDMHTVWRLYEIENVLVIEHEATANPNGALPLWLVNITALQNTKKAFLNLQRIVSLPQYQQASHQFTASHCNDYQQP